MVIILITLNVEIWSWIRYQAKTIKLIFAAPLLNM
jgi:hypothetical protein